MLHGNLNGAVDGGTSFLHDLIRNCLESGWKCTTSGARQFLNIHARDRLSAFISGDRTALNALHEVTLYLLTSTKVQRLYSAGIVTRRAGWIFPKHEWPYKSVDLYLNLLQFLFY